MDEKNDGKTPETDAEAFDAIRIAVGRTIDLSVVSADFARRLERERNRLAAEVLRLQEQLQAAEKEAHRKDVLLVEAIYGQPCPTQRQWEQMQELVAKAFASRARSASTTALEENARLTRECEFHAKQCARVDELRHRAEAELAKLRKSVQEFWEEK